MSHVITSFYGPPGRYFAPPFYIEISGGNRRFFSTSASQPPQGLLGDPPRLGFFYGHVFLSLITNDIILIYITRI